MKKIKAEKIKVSREKLGRQWCYAICDDEKLTIKIDERIKGKRELKYLMHELDHILNKDHTETRVLRNSRIMAEVLWLEGYRKVEL